MYNSINYLINIYNWIIRNEYNYNYFNYKNELDYKKM